MLVYPSTFLKAFSAMAASHPLAAALAFALLLAYGASVQAQNTPQDYLNAHNVARAREGVAAIKWNATVAAYAQRYANLRRADCALIHSNGPYGENLFRGSGKEWSGTEAVQSWVSERQFYNYNTNTCAPSKVCGHYTQVVWRKSTSVGCARVKCNSGAIFITCNYYPPGNYVGQKPY